MVMVANRKTQPQMTEDLNLFLGSHTDAFTTWFVNIGSLKLTRITTIYAVSYNLVVILNLFSCYRLHGLLDKLQSITAGNATGIHVPALALTSYC